MKNLIYKEFKLSCTNTVVWPLLFLFSLTALIPNFPKAACFLYFVSFYPFMFLGANKGTATNDLYFTLTLPVSRKQIITARMISVSLVLLIYTILVTITSTISYFFIKVPIDPGTAMKDIVNIPNHEIGLGYNGLLSIIGFAVLSYAIFNLFFFTLFYRTGKKFALPIIVSIIVAFIFYTVLTIVLPLTVSQYYELFNEWNALVQLLTFFISLLLAIGLNILTIKLSYKLFKKVDF